AQPAQRRARRFFSAALAQRMRVQKASRPSPDAEIGIPLVLLPYQRKGAMAIVMERPMPTVTIEDAQVHLPELIARLQPGEEIIITRDHKPVARLTATLESPKPRRQLGTLKGTALYIAPDFDDPLED